MTPERMAALVARWVRFYTRNLPSPIAGRRIDEIDADLHDHVAHERAHGTSDGRIAFSIAARMVRGLPADAAWRGQAKPRRTASRSAARVALATAAILLVPLVAMQFSDGVAWSLADFVFAGVLLAGTGLLLELAARKPRSLAYRTAAAAVGAAAILFGEADDAPGLVLFGGLLIVGTVALAVRTAQRSR
jgi:hypothetical protein